MMFKRNICSERLNTYTEKSVWEHLNFIHSVKTAFCLTLKTSLKMKQRFIHYAVSSEWTMRDMVLTSRNGPFENISWKYFINYLLNLVKDPVNCQLHNAQTYTEAVQKSSQSVHALQHISASWKCSCYLIMRNS
jgi:hypothetical protein